MMRPAPDEQLFMEALRAAPLAPPVAIGPGAGISAPAPDGHGRVRGCCECGAAFRIRHGAGRLFCRKACKVAWENRYTVRGRQLMLLVMAAREGTRGKPAAKAAGRRAAQLAREAMQQWRDEDAAAGRASAADYFGLAWAMGYRQR
jgi:hypothetical protein